MVDNPKNCVYTSPVATLQGERQTKSRAVAQSGSALAWGARGRGFESRLPDVNKTRKERQFYDCRSFFFSGLYVKSGHRATFEIRPLYMPCICPL